MTTIQSSRRRGTDFGKSLLPTGTFDICRFVRFGLVPTGHRFGVLMGRVMKMPPLIRRTAKGECKTIVLNRFGSADQNRIPIASSSRGFFVLRDGA